MKHKIVVFRTDGSHKHGIGHLMRCLSLADELCKRGDILPVFFSHHSPLQVSISSAFNHKIFYQRGFAGEVTITRRIRKYLEANEVSGLILDLPNDLSERELKSLGKVEVPRIIFDDHGKARDEFDTVINAIAHPDHRENSSPKNKLFQGPDYIILPESTGPKLKWDQDSNKVLIAMGGSDPHNITLKALKAVSALKTDLEIHLLLGPGFSNKGSIEDARKEIFQPLHIHEGIKMAKLPEFLGQFKIAIMSFGLTVYSAAQIGLPVICLAHNHQGAEAAQAFFSLYKTGTFLGEHLEVSRSKLAKTTIDFLENEKMLNEYSAAGKKAVDGKGLARVTDIILKTLS
jgi:UDP-2,4-diacetamido-2,4,6-trideoxy-beta-L-altropyranose hydrolase